MEITDAHLPGVIWIEGGKLLRRSCIQLSIILKKWLLRWKMKDPFHCFVIYMAIQERRMFLCMAVTTLKLLRKLEFSHLSLESFAHILISTTQGLVCRSLKKQQLELQLSMNWSFQIFSQWKAHFVEMTLVQMLECILLENTWSKLEEIYADLCYYTITFKFQKTLKFKQKDKKGKSNYQQRSIVRTLNKLKKFLWEN